MSAMAAEKRSDSKWKDADDPEAGSELQRPAVLLPPEKDRPGALKRWWSNPIVRQVLGTILGLAVIAGVIGLVAIRLQQTPAQSGSSGTTAEAGTKTAAAADDRSVTERFSVLQDSLEAAIERYENRQRDFIEGAGARNASRTEVDCGDLASLYRTVDERFVDLAAEFQSSRSLLDSQHRERFRDLFDRVSGVNRDFDQSGCPRPE